MKKLLQSIFLILTIGFSTHVSAQLRCNFTADTLEGCAPLRVNFTDQSSGGGTIIYRNWDFGNGGFSNTNNPAPSRVYATSGTFTVTLTVSDGIDTATKTITNYITVFKNPQVSFNYTKLTNCPPIQVNFTDQTTLGDAPIKTYAWDYGDLTAPGTAKNPSHTYNFRGTYSVILTVEDTNGCKGSFERKDIIVVDKPEAKFNVSKRSDCQAPLTTTFTNNSTGKAPLTYAWTFGDGNTSASTSPTHTYTATGNYDVKLVVTDVNGCTDTLEYKKLVSIGQTKADFSAPDTVCLHQPDSFINKSVGAQDFLWTFGGTDTSSKESPFYAFSTPGIKTVRLIGSSGPGCIDTLSKTVYVQEIKADYSVSYPNICSPNEVRLKDSSSITPAVTGVFTWIEGTNQKEATGLDTTVAFPVSNCNKIQRQVTYVAESALGCKDTILKNIVEYQNSGVSIQQITNGDHCVKDTISYRMAGCVLNGAKSFSWNFGTGKPGDTSNQQNPTNVIILDTSGTYTTTLEVIDSAGCKLTARASYKVGEKPFANFVIQDDTLCFKEQFVFRSISTDSTKIDEYTWEFGDKQGGSGKVTSHIYDSIGVYRVKLIADDNLCQDDTVLSVYVSGPGASIDYNNTASCKFPLRQSFKLASFGYYSKFYWDFGDSSAIDSVNVNPVHIYPGPGSYEVKLKLVNDTTGCVSEAKLPISPIEVTADIRALQVNCADSVVEFDGTNSGGNIGFNFFWDFDNGRNSLRNPRPTTTFPTDGIYNVSLIVVGADSCSDTAILPVYILPNQKAFTLPDINFCDGDTLMLHATDSFGVHGPKGSGAGNLRSAYDTILNKFVGNSNNQFFFWKVNDTLRSNDSSYFEYPLHVDASKPKVGYQTDTLKLSLKSVDSSYFYFYQIIQPPAPIRYEYKDFDGCVEETTVNLIIHQLNPIFRTEDSTVCVGDSIWFQDTSQLTVPSYTWYFGTGDSSNLSSPTYAYNKRGVFNAKYVTKNAHCEDSLIIPITVQGVDSLKFYASLRDTSCYPATTLFFDQSVGDSITWRYWDFGDGRTPIRSPLKDSLTKTYTDPGEFAVKLIVETSYGCQDSITYDKYISVKGPFARFSISDDSICLFEEVTYKLDTTNEFTYNLEWDFSDGFVDTTDTSVKQINHRYNKVGILSPVLVYRDSSRTCERAFTDTIVIEQVIADFELSDTAGCKPFKVDFTDKSSLGDQWSWKFGDNNTDSQSNPSNTYLQEGQYAVELIYSNKRNSCLDTAIKTLTVLPRPTVKAVSDTTICLGDSIQLDANGAVIYRWSPTTYMSNRNIKNPKVAPILTQQYVVEGSDSNNCSATDSVLVKVQQIPEITMPNDTTIIIGEQFTTAPVVLFGASYRWEPLSGIDCDTCIKPIFDPVKSTTYTLFIKDSTGCFETSRSFFVNVDEKYSVDVPEGFTPNGDGSNDLIFPAGWGLEGILEFKVFNRWGEIVFESTPQQLGWDGYYKGELQNQDTYLWFVKATTVSGEEITKEGFFTLFR